MAKLTASNLIYSHPFLSLNGVQGWNPCVGASPPHPLVHNLFVNAISNNSLLDKLQQIELLANIEQRIIKQYM